MMNHSLAVALPPSSVWLPLSSVLPNISPGRGGVGVLGTHSLERRRRRPASLCTLELSSHTEFESGRVVSVGCLPPTLQCSPHTYFCRTASEQQLERNSKPFFAQIRLSLRLDWLSDGRLRRLATYFCSKRNA
ncbi:hypothetical protein FVEG_16758 [Fusarium verticillioides 7600]|uniref:Uncharacterized protein n=1 Tax=Gibberella moniliformis (strain M3125 / FGSC 7600) TaxID=334819 RepID=W7N334_GIBM7|nr:hypothetical protein FVEG_16758 [Fusarium verticillioides 7600]EWG51147.1 hypothetical protein FVEG_16758 [Fusarium verticillioides 7600]